MKMTRLFSILVLIIMVLKTAPLQQYFSPEQDPIQLAAGEEKGDEDKVKEKKEVSETFDVVALHPLRRTHGLSYLRSSDLRYHSPHLESFTPPPDFM